MAANDIVRDLGNELEYIGDRFIEEAEAEDNVLFLYFDDGTRVAITVEEV